MIFFRTEPQLIKLRKEYDEVEERKSSLRQVVQFLADLKELQHDYLNYREENPRKKVAVSTYFCVFLNCSGSASLLEAFSCGQTCISTYIWLTLNSSILIKTLLWNQLASHCSISISLFFSLVLETDIFERKLIPPFLCSKIKEHVNITVILRSSIFLIETIGILRVRNR